MPTSVATQVSYSRIDGYTTYEAMAGGVSAIYNGGRPPTLFSPAAPTHAAASQSVVR